MKKKNRTVPLISLNKVTPFILISLVILSLQILNQINGLYAEQKEKSLETYPETPEGVVEAFCNEDFTGTGAGISSKGWAKIQQYTTWVDAPGWDVGILIVDFKANKIRENYKTAEVKVEYKTVGKYYSDDIGPVFEKAQINEIVIYRLIGRDNQWKIESPQLPPHISVKIIIRHLRELITEEKDIKKIKRMNQVLKDIESTLSRSRTK